MIDQGEDMVPYQGFTPIAGDEFVYEMALSAFLPPNSRGVPNWFPANPGEQMAVKRNDQLAAIVKNGAQLSRSVGADLARWARGAAVDNSDKVDSIAEYGRELSAVLKRNDKKEIAEWWSETESRRKAMQIPADRLANMDSAVARALGE